MQKRLTALLTAGSLIAGAATAAIFGPARADSMKTSDTPQHWTVTTTDQAPPDSARQIAQDHDRNRQMATKSTHAMPMMRGNKKFKKGATSTRAMKKGAHKYATKGSD